MLHLREAEEEAGIRLIDRVQRFVGFGHGGRAGGAKVTNEIGAEFVALDCAVAEADWSVAW